MTFTPSTDAVLALAGKCALDKDTVLKRGQVPDWAGFLTLAADVQSDRIVWATYAWGPNLYGACIDHGVHMCDPLSDQARLHLETLRDSEYKSKSGASFLIQNFGVDLGGYRSCPVAEFVLSRSEILNLRGFESVENFERPFLTNPESPYDPILVNTHQYKHEIYCALNVSIETLNARPASRPLSLMFHDEIDQSIAEELTSEIFARHDQDFILKTFARLPDRCNDSLTLAAYNLMLGHHFGLHRLTDADWSRFLNPTEQAA